MSRPNSPTDSSVTRIWLFGPPHDGDQPVVTRVALPPAAATAKTDVAPSPIVASNAILVPSGDHERACGASRLPLQSCFRPEPSAFTTKIAQVPSDEPARSANAIWRPLGDQFGSTPVIGAVAFS